jgi:hypothetical protein
MKRQHKKREAITKTASLTGWLKPPKRQIYEIK